VATQEEEPKTTEKDVMMTKFDVDVMDEREDGELTQLMGLEDIEVDVKMTDVGEAGEQATHDVMKDEMNEMAGEQAAHDVMKDEMDEMVGEQATHDVMKGEMNEMVGEQTQRREFEVKVVDAEMSAGEQTQLRDGLVLGAGEQTHGGVAQDSCSGSVMGAEEYDEDWVVDSVVEVVVEAGERTKEGGGRSSESKQVDLEVEAADGISCGGSVEEVEDYEDWWQDSVIIEIGADDDATVWDSGLDACAFQKQIADDADIDVGYENGTGDGYEGSVFGFVSGVDSLDLTE
jgi:hypothetical protein